MRIKLAHCLAQVGIKPTSHTELFMRKLLGQRLDIDWKIALITIVSTTLLVVDAYHRLFPQKYWDRVLLYLLIPLLIIILVFRDDPRRYGFTLGGVETFALSRLAYDPECGVDHKLHVKGVDGPITVDVAVVAGGDAQSGVYRQLHVKSVYRTV